MNSKGVLVALAIAFYVMNRRNGRSGTPQPTQTQLELERLRERLNQMDHNMRLYANEMENRFSTIADLKVNPVSSQPHQHYADVDISRHRDTPRSRAVRT